MHCKRTVLMLGLIAAASLPAPDACAEAVPRFEITPFVGYRAGGNFEADATDTTPKKSVDVREDGSFGLDLGLYRDEHGFYEFLYSQQTAGVDSNDPLLSGLDVKIEYYQFGGTAMFPGETDWLVPYLSMTIGATRWSADGFDSDTKFSGSLGGGLRIPFSDYLVATLGLRGYLTFVQSNTSFFCVSDAEGGGCLVKSSGSTFFQAEAQLGLTFRF